MRILDNPNDFQQVLDQGNGVIYNDFARNGKDGLKYNVLHVASCPYLKTAKANKNKRYFTDIEKARAWLLENRPNNWRECPCISIAPKRQEMKKTPENGTIGSGRNSEWNGLQDADPASILRWAAQAASDGNVERASMLVVGAASSLVHARDPNAAKQVLDGINLPVEEKCALVRAIFTALRTQPQSSGTANNVVAELAAVIDPLDPYALGAVVYSDLSRDDATIIPDRLKHVNDALQAAQPVGAPPDAYKDRLAPLADPLDDAVSLLLDYDTPSVNLKLLTFYIALAMSAHLTAGHLPRAAKLLRQATASKAWERLTPANRVDLADMLVAYPAHLPSDVQALVLRTYRGAADTLIQRLPQGDPILLDAVVHVLSDLDTREGASVRARREARLRELEGGPSQVPPVKALPLAGRRIAIAGGDEPVRRRAMMALKELGAARVIEVPPAYEANLHAAEVFERLRSVELVVEVSRKTKHQTGMAVRDAVGRLGDKLIHVYADGSGFSSIVRAVLERS